MSKPQLSAAINDFADVVTKFNALSDNVGDLTLLTDSANDLVAAINARDSVVGNLSSLTSAMDSSSVIAAINSLHLIVLNADSDLTALIGAKADSSHTHVEADITDLDKYTQSQVNALLAGKEPANNFILTDSDIGVKIQEYKSTYLLDSDIGVTVQAYSPFYLSDSDIGSTVQGYNANIVKSNVENTFTQRQRVVKNVGATPTYTTGQLELRNTDAGDVSIGFNRDGNSGAQLRHGGNGLILSGNSRTASADFLVTGTVGNLSDIRTKTDLTQIENPLDIIRQITGYYYTDKDTGKRRVGVIAQDVEKAMKELVGKNGDLLHVYYANMTALLLEGIKKLEEEVKRNSCSCNCKLQD